MQWILHSTSWAYSQIFMMCLSYKTRNPGEEEPQKTPLKFKAVTSNSQWDWYYLWKTMRWHRGAVRNTQRSHSPGPALIPLHCCCGGERSPPGGAGGVSAAGAAPCPHSATLFHPGACQWGRTQKLLCPSCGQQSSCYRLRQLSAVRALFTLG